MPYREKQSVHPEPLSSSGGKQEDINMSVALQPRDAPPRLLSDLAGGGADEDSKDTATVHVGAAAVPSSSAATVARSPSMPTVEEGRVMPQQHARSVPPQSPHDDDHGNVSPGERKIEDTPARWQQRQDQQGATTSLSSSASLQTNTQFRLSFADMTQTGGDVAGDGGRPLIEEGNDKVAAAGDCQQQQQQNPMIYKSGLAQAVEDIESPATIVTGHAGHHPHAGTTPDHPSPANENVPQQIRFTGNPYERPYQSPAKPPDVSYSQRQMMSTISPLHAPIESAGSNNIHDIPSIQHQVSHDLSSASSLGSQSASLVSSVATPPAYLLAGSGSSGKYYGQQQHRAASKPQVYSAIGSLESLTSPSSMSAKILASHQHQYQRVAAGPMIPPPNSRQSITKASNAERPPSNRGIVIGATGKTDSKVCGASDRPSLLSQVEKKGGLAQPRKEGQKRSKEKEKGSVNISSEGVADHSEKSRTTSNIKLKSSLRHRSSSGGDNTAPGLLKEKKKKRKSKKKSVKIDTSSMVIPSKQAEMFRPSCDAYTPRMGRKKIEYKPAEHRTPVQKMSASMGTISRPNFRDALRRVAMIIQQHVVKIEERFEAGVHGSDDSGLFRRSMRESFTEDNFVTPRYKCTVLRVPMGRPGIVYGHRKVKVEYKVPTVEEIYEFGHQLFKAVQLSSECSIVCLIYVERLMEAAKVPLLADTWKPIFMAGLLLASKVWQDLSSWNIEFASVYPQFSLDAINRLELQFLKNVKWDLYISSSLYAKYYFALRSLLEKQDFRQRYNRMTGVGGVSASEAMKVQKRTERVKEEALIQLSRSM